MRGLASAAALLATAVLSGCGAHAVEDAPSLDEVAAVTRSDSYRFEMTLRVEGLTDEESVTAVGAADPVARRGFVRYDLKDGYEVRQIGADMYTRFGAFASEGWEKETTAGGELLSGPIGAFSEPGDALETLARHGRDVAAGPGDPSDGVATSHYRGEVPTVDLFGARLTDEERKELEDRIRESHSATAAVEAWAGADGLLRKLEFEVSITDDGRTGRMFSSIRFFDFGKPVEVEVPSASEIVESGGVGKAIEITGPCKSEATPHSAESVIEALRTAGFSVETSCDGDETIIYALLEGGGDEDAVLCIVTRGPEPTESFDVPLAEGNVACAPEPSQRAALRTILDDL